jgi:FixJ family two-component response regulator
MNNAVSTVFVIDDDSSVRRALSNFLAASGYQVRSFESAELFLAAQDLDSPGCLLLDVCLSGLSGMELQRALSVSSHMRPIVFLTGQSDIQTSVTAMKAGAVDFLTKPIDCAQLTEAVERALRRDAETRLERNLRRSIEVRFDALTPRERQVMAQVIHGKLNKQIAADLGTGEKTIKVHRARVMSKMQARSVPELVRLGTRIGLTGDASFRRAELLRCSA